MAYVYIVECSDGTYYTGWTLDTATRLQAHNAGIGARYTRGRRPVRLVHLEKQANSNTARKREYAIKKMTRSQKEALIKEKGEKNMFVKDANKQAISVVTGVKRKTLAVGQKGLMEKFYLDAGSTLPKHQHPHEQIGYLVSGALILHIGNESGTMRPGDSWAVAGGVEHWAEVLESAEAIEVFVPVREDYLD
jgi:predicted GIY-YIG superfamily endonuclease